MLDTHATAGTGPNRPTGPQLVLDTHTLVSTPIEDYIKITKRGHLC